MVVFLRYLFNEAYLKEAVRDDWLKLYDKPYVDETIDRIMAWKPDVHRLLESLEETVYLTRKKVCAHGQPGGCREESEDRSMCNEGLSWLGGGSGVDTGIRLGDLVTVKPGHPF